MEHLRELDYALSVISSGRSLDVVGRPGSGRSYFLRRLAGLLRESGMTPMQVQGVPALKGVPLSALTLAGITGDPTQRQGAGAVAAAYEALASKASAASLVVMVDDWDDLDEPSWGVISAVGRTRRLPIVLTRDRARGGVDHALADPVLASAMTIALRPLGIEPLGQLITSHVGGTVSEEMISRVFAKSGGLVGLALKIVDAATLDGRIHPDAEGVWQSQSNLWDPHLLAAAEAMLVSVSADERDALTKLALTGFLAVEDATRLVGRATLHQLESLQLVTSSATAQGLSVSVSPPLLSEYLSDPDAGQEIRAFHLRAEAEEIVGPLAPGRTATPTGVNTPDSAFVQMVHEHQASIRAAAKAEWDHAHDAIAGVRYLRSLIETGAGDSAIEALMEQCDRLAAPPDVHADIVRLRAEWLAYRVGDAAAALRLLDEQRAVPGVDGRLLDAQHVQVSLAVGDVPDDADALLELDDDLTPRTRGTLLDVRAYVRLVRGEFGLALDDWSAAHALEGHTVGYKEDVVGPLALLGLGRSDEALQLATTMYEQARLRLDVDALHCNAYALSLVLTSLGLYRQLGPLLELNNALGRPQPRLDAEYEAVRQFADISARRSTRTRPRQRRSAAAEPVLPTGRSWPRARALARAGALDQAARELWEASQRAWARGARLSGAVSALTSLEIAPDLERLAVARREVGTVDPGYLSAYLDYVGALAGDSADDLLHVARELAHLRLIGHAYVAYVRAEELLASAGARAAEEDAAAERRALMRRADFADYDTSRFLRATVRLTEREVEVATLAAEGATNQEIADGLRVSIRTAEGHLHRAMRKLGAASRLELGVPLKDYLIRQGH